MIDCVALQRGGSTGQGTFGVITFAGQRLYTAELPARANAPQLSRIPAGIYLCDWAKSPKFGWCYHVRNVRGRSNILIHAGNYVGDVNLGFRAHSHGCILLCRGIGQLGGQAAGLVSGPAVRLFGRVLQGQPFLLEVRNA